MSSITHNQAPGVIGGYQLALPTAFPGTGQALRYAGTFPQLEWYTPAGNTEFESYRASIPIKYNAQAATVTNVTLSGSPASADTDDYDLSFGGVLLVRAQTDNSENGLYDVNPFGAWTRHISMPDNTSSAYGAIITVGPGGTLYGNTIWYSQSDGSGAVPLVQIPTFATGTFCAPRLTSAQRDALTAVNGMLIYNTTTNKFQGRENGSWVNLV